MSQSKTIEFYFDFGSPATFLAYTQIEAIAERTGAELVWKPMLLGGVFKATGNASPVLIPAKGRWMMGDIMRWAERYGTHIRYPEGFPLNTLALMRGVIGFQQTQSAATARRFIDVMFRAIWQQQQDLRDSETLAQVLTENDFDPDAFLVMVSDPEIKQALIHQTTTAVERGVFGAQRSLSAARCTLVRTGWIGLRQRPRLPRNRAREPLPSFCYVQPGHSLRRQALTAPSRCHQPVLLCTPLATCDRAGNSRPAPPARKPIVSPVRARRACRMSLAVGPGDKPE